MTTTTELDSNTDRDDPRYAALARLKASRMHLQSVLIPPGRTKRASGAADRDTGGLGGTLRTLWSFVHSHDGEGLFQTVRVFIDKWWTRQPWQPTASLLGQAVEAEVAPWVRRHPTTAIALGVCAGAAITWARPWRWLALHAQARSLKRYAGHWISKELRSPTMQMLIATSIATWISQRQAATSASVTPESGTQTGPQVGSI